MDQFCRGLNAKGFHGFLFVSFGCSRGNAHNTGMLSAFHFLRPEWLLLLVPAALLYLVVLRREDVSKRWKELCLMLLVHHTAAVREYAYDRHSSVGTLDKALDEANAKGWVVGDMKRDWKAIFPR